jgi:hypothetical protein
MQELHTTQASRFRSTCNKVISHRNRWMHIAVLGFASLATIQTTDDEKAPRRSLLKCLWSGTLTRYHLEREPADSLEAENEGEIGENGDRKFEIVKTVPEIISTN